MLLASEALVVVSFALEQLLVMGFTVEFTLKSRKGAKAADTGRAAALGTSQGGGKHTEDKCY